MIKGAITGEQATRYSRDITYFMEDRYILPETQRPIQLEWWQKDYILKPLFYDLGEDGLRKYNVALLGMPKKNGKSALGAGIGVYFIFCDEPYGEIIVAANAKDQAAMIIYGKMRRSVSLEPSLKRAVLPVKDRIEVRSTGTIARCLAHRFDTAAGTNPNLTLFDELWAFTDRKFFDELTVVPTRIQPLVVIVTYAGFQEQGLLWDLYSDGLAGETIIDTGDPEILIKRGRKDPGMLMYWSNKNLASWVSAKYLNAQRNRLPPEVFARLHQNKWVAAGSKFITQDDINSIHSTPWVVQTAARTDRSFQYVIANDLGISDNRTCRLVGHYDPEDGKAYIDNIRIWQGTPEQHVPIKEVEQDLVDCVKQYGASKIVIDPWQMEYVIQRLQGIYDVVPFNFSADIVHLSQVLVNMIRSKRVVSYNEPLLDTELKNTIIRNTAAGWRIDHSAKKTNDIVITLGMMLMEAMRATYGQLILPGDDEFRQQPIAFGGIRGREF